MKSGTAVTSVEQAAAYLEDLINLERNPDLSRARLSLEPIRALLERVGNPEQHLSIVHIAGSKGKGSTALFAESILAAAGERVGTFTSPHLERWTERFRIGGREVPGAALAQCVEQLRPHIDALRRENAAQVPSFFDATTAAALLLFAGAGVDRAVLEVGLGGRLDSTNAVTPAATCITSIELEHTEKLGDNLAAIAGEKAGILKPGVPCVMGELPSDAQRVVRDRADQIGAPLLRSGVDFWVECESIALPNLGSAIRYRESNGFELDASLSVLGEHQASNAALAVAAIRRLSPVYSEGSFTAAVQKGLVNARLPGRVELVERRPWVVIDAAHTAASARALARALTPLRARRSHFVLSVSAGKPLSEILEALLPFASSLTFTRAEPLRSLDPLLLARAFRSLHASVPHRVVPNPHLALRSARASLEDDDLLCVTGSVYLAGIARRVFGCGAALEG